MPKDGRMAYRILNRISWNEEAQLVGEPLSRLQGITLFLLTPSEDRFWSPVSFGPREVRVVGGS